MVLVSEARRRTLPLLHPRATVQLLSPVVLWLVGDVPVVGCDRVWIHSRSILSLVPALTTDATVDDDIEAVDSLRTKVACQRLRQHSLGCLGSGKSNSHRLPPKSSGGSSDGNHSLPPRSHLGPNVLCHSEKPVHVRLHRHLQLLVGDVLICGPNSIAGIIHDSVDLSQLLLNGGQSSREGSRVCDISGRSQRARILCSCCFQLAGGSAHHRHLVALFGPLPHTGHPQPRANSDHNTNTTRHSYKPADLLSPM